MANQRTRRVRFLLGTSKKIDISEMMLDIQESLLDKFISDEFSSVDDLTRHYNSTLGDILDSHAPVVTKSVVVPNSIQMR